MILVNLGAFALGLYFLYQENIGFRFNRWVDIPIVTILLGIPTLNLIYVGMTGRARSGGLSAQRTDTKKEDPEKESPKPDE